MNRSEANRTLELTLDDLRYVYARLGALFASLTEHEGSIPSGDASAERVSGGGGGGSPVERAAGRRDPSFCPGLWSLSTHPL